MSTIPASTVAPELEALTALVQRLEERDAAMTSLHDERATNGDADNARRLAAKREGLRLALADARAELHRLRAADQEAIARSGYAELVDDATVPLINYSVALDEIYTLRKALAHEALCQQAHLEFKSFPKSRRALAEEAVNRMQSAARGYAEHSYGGRSSQVMRHALREAGAPETLTRAAWETSRGLSPRLGRGE